MRPELIYNLLHANIFYETMLLIVTTPLRELCIKMTDIPQLTEPQSTTMAGVSLEGCVGREERWTIFIPSYKPGRGKTPRSA